MLLSYFCKRKVNSFYWFTFLWLLLYVSAPVYAQTFAPVPVTGFNQDVIAEGAPSSLATTSIQMDGPSSNTVFYSNAFRNYAGFTYGGLPDNGTLVTGTSTYQLAPYTGNNALLLQRTETGSFLLVTPANFSQIRVLCLSTEGTSLINMVLTFTDGTTTNALTNYALSDWFNGGNVVAQALGRCNRVASGPVVSGQTTNPRMYYIDYILSCTDKLKTLQKISFTNVTTGGTNAPYPNAIFFGLSGVAFSQSITTTSVTPADCFGANGSATIAATGTAAPFTYSWNTNPAQNTATASGLPAGNYTCSVKDAAGCITPYAVTIPSQSNLSIKVHNDTTICAGSSIPANTISNATNFSWTPPDGVSNTAIANPVLTPAATTTYIVTGVLGACIANKSFTVTVVPGITVNAGADILLVAGGSAQLNGQSSATGSYTTYLWTPSTGLNATNILNPKATPVTTTTYTLTATSDNGCKASDDVTVTVIPSCLKVMNAFTPNGDGINDRWIITDGSCLLNAKVKVHNRYGSVVYQSNDYKNDWDGTYHNKLLPDGTYYYVIYYTLLSGEVKFLNGNVTILR